MKKRRHKISTLGVAIVMILTSYFVMASNNSSISRDDVEACIWTDDTKVDLKVGIQFDGSCSRGEGTISYRWFFGDGTESTDEDPDHTYESEGVYQVSLVVKDSNNIYDLKTTTITVVNYYPNAVAGSDSTVNEDDVVDFDASDSYDENDDIASYEWNFGDGSTAAGIQTTHVYEDEGTYYATLTVTDNDEAFDMDVIMITVNNEVPITDGMANDEVDDDLTIAEDDAVTFDGSQSTDTSSDMPLLRYAWDFGDGSKGYGLTTSHTYTKQGVYYATLRVTDDNAAYTEDTIMITVLNTPPSANAGPDQTVDEGDTVFFDGTATSDTPSDEPLLNYDWTFGGRGTSPTYNWYDDGTNDIELTVTDDDGLESRDSTTINIRNVAPTAGIDGAYVVVDFRLRAAGKKWQAVDLKVTEPGREVTSIGIVRYPGSPDDQAVTAEDVKINIAEDVTATVYYTPKANGATPTWLTLTFEDGTSKTLFRSFNNQKPEEWVWVHDMNEHISGKPIHFEGSVYDPGTDDIDVTWDFGDGSSPITSRYLSNGNHPMQIREHHIHAFPYGVYTVDLQAVDDDGGIGFMPLTVTNTERLTSTNIAPKVSSSGGKTVLEDEPVTLTGMGKDTGSDQGILTYTWYLGDGTILNGPVVTHSFAKAGTYHPTLVVEDDEGAIGTTSELVEVLNVAPTAVANADDIALVEDDTISLDAHSSSDTPSDLAILQYAWDFGDGSKGFGIETTHVYSKRGVYQVILTTTDDNGAASTHQLTIDVQNVEPYDIKITAEENVNEDELIFFEVAASDTPSDLSLLKFAWDFGDGSFGSGYSTTHAFTTEGTYTVKITVADDDGAFKERSVHINVSNPAPVIFGGFAKSFYGPQMNIRFHGRGFDTPSDQSTLMLEWEFGDGTIIGEANNAMGMIAEDYIEYHKYITVTAQTFTVTFTVIDEHGEFTSEAIVINVKVDTDGDQLLDGDEISLGSDPYNFDTDGDWLIDSYEITPPPEVPSKSWSRDTNPKRDDSDNDGCSDWEELWPAEDGYITDPNNPDTDGDGLEDCKEVYAQAFKSEARYKIPDVNVWTQEVGKVVVPVFNVKTEAPVSAIIRAEARFGITHTKIGDLKLKVGHEDSSGSFWEHIIVNLDEIEESSVTIRERTVESSDILFDVVDLLSVGFSASDFTTSRTWGLIVEDHELGGNCHVEYFEIHIYTRTNPKVDDSDGDGLTDNEEVSLGEYGWFTDPWNSDTDGDGLSDSTEVEVKKTDPTRSDTDRDGTLDGDDFDPLNDLMAKLDLQTITDLGECSAESMFFEVHIPHLDKTFYTDHRNQPNHCGYPHFDYDRQYSFDVPDSEETYSVLLALWEDNTCGDDCWDIYPDDRFNAISITMPVLHGMTSFNTSGDEDGNPDKHDAEVTFRLGTVRPNRINTILLTPNDADALFQASDGKLRYIGEQDFYLIILDVASSTGPFVAGHNAIIVPRTVFVNSELSQTLEDNKNDATGLANYLQELQFGRLDQGKDTTTGSVSGVMLSQEGDDISSAEASSILNMLTQDADGNPIAEYVEVTDELVTLNLDDDLLNLIPLEGLEFDKLGGDPDSGCVEAITESLGDVLKVVFFPVILIGKAIVKLTKILVEGLKLIVDAIIDAIALIVDAIKSIVDLVLKVVEWTVAWVYDNIVSGIISVIAPVVLLSLRILGGPVFEELGKALFDSLDYVLTWVAKDFVSGVSDIVRGAMEVGAALVDVVGAFASCAGDILEGTIEGCGEILDALTDLSISLGDIMVAAAKLGASAVVAAFTVLLRLCGVIGNYREMTADERVVAESVFGNSVNLDKVRIYQFSPCVEIAGMLQRLFRWDIDGTSPFTTQYLINVPLGSDFDNTTLIHELTHVWQYEREGSFVMLDAWGSQCEWCGAGYDYGYNNRFNGNGAEDDLQERLRDFEYNAGAAFESFNPEQQAKMIEHYYERRYVMNASGNNFDYSAWQPYADLVCEGDACANTIFLEWVGSGDYRRDGINPEEGDASVTNFEFRVVYKSVDNDPPTRIRVHIQKGGTPLPGSPFTMTFQDFVVPGGDYTTGATYTYFTQLVDSGTDYEYFFTASDGIDWCTGPPALWTAGPEVI